MGSQRVGHDWATNISLHFTSADISLSIISINAVENDNTSSFFHDWVVCMCVCVHMCVYSVQFSSVAQSCPTLYNPMNCSTPGLPIRHQFRVHLNSCPSSQLCHSIISSFVVPFSSCPQSFPASGSFLMSHLFASGGQSIGVSTSTLVCVLHFIHSSVNGHLTLFPYFGYCK